MELSLDFAGLSEYLLGQRQPKQYQSSSDERPLSGYTWGSMVTSLSPRETTDAPENNAYAEMPRSYHEETIRLNKDTSAGFSEIRDRRFQIELPCKSKAQFDNRPIDACLAIYMDPLVEEYQPYYYALKYDLIRYDQYLRRYEALRPELGKNAAGHTSNLYRRVEQTLFRQFRLRPPSIRFVLTKTYVTPKKRNHYCETKSFYAKDFMETCEGIFERQERRNKAAKERKKMTAKLRYQILVRDNFACSICGRTAAEGAILQVDHIKPVSKGGKSTPSNLRTLCSLCNWGKGSYFNPEGLN